ncbi:hypothetical protein MLD38_002294 [Melastoma candidum]|uniref:Uncharacterized protein n=1 Tax=Melastoma candidum TaxID=119954 RepID=A0ACB9SH93_9MYRT|nr:hypothetical protein MLD38_002294 [Melastoma candidum]
MQCPAYRPPCAFRIQSQSAYWDLTIRKSDSVAESSFVLVRPIFGMGGLSTLVVRAWTVVREEVRVFVQDITGNSRNHNHPQLIRLLTSHKLLQAWFGFMIRSFLFTPVGEDCA